MLCWLFLTAWLPSSVQNPSSRDPNQPNFDLVWEDSQVQYNTVTNGVVSLCVLVRSCLLIIRLAQI